MLRLVISALAVTFASYATAQMNSSDYAARTSTADSSNANELQEVIVTAEKRSESLQNVPIAVSVVSSSDLEKLGVSNIANLNVAVPSLNMTNTYGRLTVSLRGIGTSNVGPAAENPTALYIDGVYYASSAASLLSLNNVQDIQVLKGPQGTLFGRNATAGLIQVVTKDPSDTPSGSLALTYGNYDTEIANAYLGGGITKNLAADLAVYAKMQGEGWGTDLATGRQVDNVKHDVSVRSKWIFSPVEGTKLTFIGDYETVNTTNITSQIRPGSTSPFSPGVVQPDYGRNNNNDTNSIQEVESRGISVRWDQKIGDLTFDSITAYRNANSTYGGDTDGTPLPLFGLSARQFDRQFTEELQLGSVEYEKLKWTSGVYFYKGTSGYDPCDIYLPGMTDLRFPNGFGGIESEAGYLQGTYEIFEATDLTLGGRYTRETRTSDDQQELIFLDGASPYSGAVYTYPNESKTFDNFSYRFSIDHRFSNELMAYASYNTGFKAGGFNISDPGSDSYKPETLDAYELGIKADLWDRRVRANVAAFYYKYNDIQVQSYISNTIVTVNGAGARSYGVDGDITVLLTEGLQLTTGVTLDNPTFTSYSSCSKGPPEGGGTTSQASCTGNELPTGTKATFSAALDYQVKSALGTIDLNGDVYHNGGYYLDVANQIGQGAYTSLGVSAGLTAPNGHYSVRAYGTNLTNNRVIVYGATIAGTQIVDYAAPRMYGIVVQYQF